MIPQARATVQAMKAYRPPLEGRRQAIRLDFNENTAGFPELLPGIESSLLAAYPEYQLLLDHLCAWLAIDQERLLITNGSDEGLFVAAFTFVEPGQKAVVSAPTFSLIPHSLQLCGAELVEVVVCPDLTFDLNGLEAALPGAKLAILASPDNPTGAMLPLARLASWLERFAETLFVIDEAYFEYCGQTALELEADNLVVSRTFSKAWGLAGLRLGYLVGHPQVIEWMRRVRSPYSVNSLAVKTLLEMLPHRQRVASYAQQTMQLKQQVLTRVRELGYRVTEGKANFFVLWAGPDAPKVETFMRDHGILVRDRSQLARMAGSVRVSVGSPAEMEKFLAVLEEFGRRTALIFDLDDTLVDTSESYDRCILELSGASPEELSALRREGGFNDDWEATAELLRRRGTPMELAEVERRGQAHYLELAPQVEKAKFDTEALARLGRRHRLFVYTGRPRTEYAPVWGERLDGLFDEVLCKGDREGRPKPAPDGLLDLLTRHGLAGGYYVGNSVDDMAAGKAAGLTTLAVTTNQSEETLRQAGADWVVDSVAALEQLFMMEESDA
ncbi:MAG: aminotransferase class I/II-fold pyridoxal phosphate-dependent enzyme [Candidatus Eremiobacteraeota bacterium]|nr:aminotransferase class I/II-fold pyridoxal phosphate-dependent enzyme [Candidatus Eremiobacteraeota bacterium]